MRPRPERSEQTAKEYFLERAAAYFDEMRDTAKKAPYGQAFDHAEAIVSTQGRQLLQLALEEALQDQIEDLEKKETTLCPKCQKKKRHAWTFIMRSVEHLSDTGKVLYGEGTEKYEEWQEGACKNLIGLCC